MLGLTAIEFFVLSVFIFAVVYWISPREYEWISFILLTFLLTLLAYNIEPGETDDLTRYFWVLDTFRENGIDELNWYISEGKYDWDTFRMGAYYFYAISRLPNNYFLSAITILIVYGSMFAVIYRASMHFNISKLYLFIATFFAVSTYWYYDTASGIRNGLAFSIAFTCAYYHLVEKRNTLLCCVGYVIAALMHSSGIMPVVLIALALLTVNFGGKYLKVFLVFGISGGAVLINYLSEVTDNSFIQSLAGKTENHNADDIVTVASGAGSGGTMYYVTAATFVLVFIMMWYVSRYITNGEYSEDLKKFHQYSSVIMYFLIGCVFTEGLVFVRFARWIVPIIGALYFMIGMQEQKSKSDRLGLYYYYDESLTERIRYQGRGVFMIIVFAYSCVHLWYLTQGSSMTGMHF